MVLNYRTALNVPKFGKGWNPFVGGIDASSMILSSDVLFAFVCMISLYS